MQAIAGDIGPGHRLPSLHTLFAPVVFSKLRRGRPLFPNGLETLALAANTAFAVVAFLGATECFRPQRPCSWPDARQVPDDMRRAITTTGFTPEMV